MSKERPWEAGPFEQWVIDELNHRVESLSTGIKGKFTSDLPQYAGPRKAWARVFSNGMVQYKDSNPNLVSDKDDEWGLAFKSGDGFFKRYGLSQNSPYGLDKQIYGYSSKNNPKYIQSSTRPNVPDPGIISIETEIQKSWFARAKINWSCHSIEQLKAITPYFLTPLQTVIIEFGWNTFNQQSLINLSDFQQILDIWDNHYRRYIDSVPKSKGNYEFIIGQIVNFEYTINDNIITGMTEVASRQLLYSGFKKDTKVSKIKDSESTYKTRYETLVNKTLNSFTTVGNQGSTDTEQIKIILSGLEKKYGTNFEKVKDHIFTGRDRQIIPYTHTRDFDDENKKGLEFTWLTMDLVVDILNGLKNKDSLNDTDYIPFFFDLNIDDITIGAHDNLISCNKNILIPNPNAPKLNSPYNPYMNAVTSPVEKFYKESSFLKTVEDAFTAIIPKTEGLADTPVEDKPLDQLILTAYTDKTKHKFFNPPESDAHSNLVDYNENVLADVSFRKVVGATNKIHRQDLDYVLNKWSNNTNTRQKTAIPDKNLSGDGLKRGYLKNIYINGGFLKDILLSPQTNNLKEVYDTLCKEINQASCNFWELTVVDAPIINGKANLKIVDTKGPPKKVNINTIYKFEYMTNNSIIKKLNFTTTLSNAQANQIIFKAGKYENASPNQLLDYSNALNVSNGKQNSNVIYNDRILKSKAGENEPNKKQNKKILLNVDDIQYYYQLLNKDGPKYKEGFLQITLFKMDGKDVDYENYDIVDIVLPKEYEDLVLYMLNDDDLKGNTNIYNAPLRNVEIELSLMGISGIKTFEFFRVTNLPPPFNDDVVVFQVMNVTHTVNENGWETRLKAQLRPAYNLQS